MKKFVFLVFVLAMAGGCLAQSDQPQSLAELAVKKKPAKKAVLHLSDEDLPPPSASSDQSTSATDVSGRGSDAADKNASGKTVTTPNQTGNNSGTRANADQRTNELKQQLAKYQKEEDVWKQSAKHYEELIANEPSDFRRQMYQDSLENDKHNAALYQQKVDEIQNELAKPQQKGQSPAHPDSSTSSGSQL